MRVRKGNKIYTISKDMESYYFSMGYEEVVQKPKEDVIAYTELGEKITKTPKSKAKKNV